MRMLLLLLLLAAALAMLASCGGKSGSSQPLAHGWPDGAYTAEYSGHVLTIYVSGEDVAVGSVDLNATWKRFDAAGGGRTSGASGSGWWYGGERPTSHGPMNVGIARGFTVRVEVAGSLRILTAHPFTTNG